MTKPAHTPGPWRVDGVKVFSDSAGKHICVPAPQMNGQTPNDEERANASLIAQAPTLLAQRDALLEALKEIQKQWLGCGNLVKALEDSRAALAMCDQGK